MMNNRVNKSKRNSSTIIYTNNLTTKAVICPVCKGSGVYYTNVTNMSSTATTAAYSHTCHGCSGKGWIVIEDYYG